jgi:hypothetical protein
MLKFKCLYQKKKIVFNLFLIFIVVFFVTTKLIRFFLPDPFTLYTSSRSEKLEIINRLSESANVAAFGSSHIETAFDPRVFDNQAHKNGLPLKSINLAIGGGNHPEQILMAKKFMEKKKIRSGKKSPQLIILEMTNGVTFPPINRYTSRAINIYDFETTNLSFKLKNLNSTSLEKSIGQKIVALNSFILNSLNTGMLSSYIFINKKFDPEKLYQNLEDDKRGYHASTHKIGDEEIKEMERVNPEKFKYINNEKLIEILLKEKNSSEFSFLFVAAPFLENKDDKECVKYPEKISIQKQEVPIFSFSCKEENPELFQSNNWSDPVHLNSNGAQILSKLLANKVTVWLKNKGAN